MKEQTRNKHEWRKHEKAVYIPKSKPEQILIPKYNFFMIQGQGNPNSPLFSEYIQVLYQVSYGLKMSLKSASATPPVGYLDYTVYPLEGVWDITEEAKKNFTGVIDKDTLVFNLMIRQPNFITNELALETIEAVKKKKPHALLDEVSFTSLEEGNCVQMLHIGSYDKEQETFDIMEQYCKDTNLERLSKEHREIYLSDVRKVAPEKLKTVLRFKLKS